MGYSKKGKDEIKCQKTKGEQLSGSPTLAILSHKGGSSLRAAQLSHYDLVNRKAPQFGSREPQLLQISAIPVLI